MLEWGIVGTGFISRTVVEAINASDGSQVRSVVGRDPARLAAFANEFDIDTATTELAEVLSDPAIGAIYVGLPNHKHHEVTALAAAAGKAVLSEKSLTTTMAEAESLRRAVADAGTFFVEGLMYLAHPMYQRVIDVLTDGRLGQLHSVNGRYAAPIADVVNPLGRGTIYNLGCYPVSLLQLVVQTMGGDGAFDDHVIAGFGNPATADDSIADAALSVRFGNGVLASVQSTDCVGMDHAFAVTGSSGVLRFVTNPWLPVAGDNVLRWEPFGGDPETIVIADPHDAFFHQIGMVERCVAAGMTEASRPSPRLADSIEIMSMLTAWEAACLS